MGKSAQICLLGIRAKWVAGKVYCREAELNAILGESTESRKIEILVVVSVCFMIMIGSSKLGCCKLLHSQSYWEEVNILEANLVWREGLVLV